MPTLRDTDINADTDIPRSGSPAWVTPGAVLDLDFINQRYFWGGAIRTTADFATYVLSGATFGANGLTGTDTTDITIALAGVGAVNPGTIACAFFNTSAPATAKQWFSLDDASTNNRAFFIQNTNASIQGTVASAAVTQANFPSGGVTTAVGIKHGCALSYAVNDFKQAANGTAQTADVAGALPIGLTTLRVGHGFGAGAAAGALSRVVLFSAPKTQAELNELSTTIRGNPSAWDPFYLGSALKAWWNADDHGTSYMVDDGAGLISSWTDRVGGLAATGTTTARPTWAAASFNSASAALTFDGVANVLAGVGAAYASILPVTTVAGEIWGLADQTETAGSNNNLFGYGGTSASGRVLARLLVTATSRARISDEGTTLTDTVATFSGPTIIGGAWVGTVESGRINGSAFTPATATIASLNTSAAGLLKIGSRINPVSVWWKGGIRHILVTTALTLAQQQQLEGWLAWDGGITSKLPAGHPYKAARP